MLAYENYIANQFGTPMFFQSALAQRPNPGIVGRIFIQTDSPYGLYRDTGTSWVNVSGGGGGGSITLTTIGTSGVATLVGTVLNIPDYSANPPNVGSLQQVTDIGYTTTNPIFINNQNLLVNFSGGGFNGYGLYATTNLQFVNTDTSASFVLQFNGARTQITAITVPDIAFNGYFPLSVNGNFADSTGNITLGAAAASLQDVLNVGNTASTSIILNDATYFATSSVYNSTINYGAIKFTYSKSGFNVDVLFPSIPSNSYQLVFPDQTVAGTNTIPLSINGNYADTFGNIDILGIASLQDVLNVGNSATENIILNDARLFVVDTLNNIEVLVYTNSGTAGLGFIDINTNNTISLNYVPNGTSNYGIDFPSPINGGYYLPLTVNGNTADATGNITTITPPAAPFDSVQFNDGGIFGGSGNFTWDNINNQAIISGRLQSIFVTNDNSTTNGQFFQTQRTITGSASPSDTYFLTSNPYLILSNGDINGTESKNFAGLFAGFTIRGNNGTSTTQPIRAVETVLVPFIEDILIDDFRHYDVKQPDATGSPGGNVVVSMYGLKIANMFNAPGFTITDAWAIYQEGNNDKSFFAGNVGIGGSPTSRVLYVNDAMEFGAAAISATSGGNSGQNLIVWIAGVQYKIQLLNP